MQEAVGSNTTVELLNQPLILKDLLKWYGFYWKGSKRDAGPGYDSESHVVVSNGKDSTSINKVKNILNKLLMHKLDLDAMIKIKTTRELKDNRNNLLN